MDNVQTYLKLLLKDDDVVVVATSGGPDSMCLLHLLCELRKTVSFKIVVAHVNHKLRIESDEEAQFVATFAKDEKLIYEYMEIDKYLDHNIENEARQRRYDFFQRLVVKYRAKYLMTAHHGDDLMETILMRLARGSSFKGYSGFLKETKYETYLLVRPLIEMTKDDIILYMDNNNFKYYIDQTNYSSKYTRNRYRMNVLPFLKKEDANVHLKFLNFSQELDKVNTFLENYVLSVYESLRIKDGLSISKIKKLDNLVVEKIIEYCLSLFYKDKVALIQKKHRDEIKKLLMSSKTNGKINLPNNAQAIKDYDIFKVVNIKDKVEYSYIFNKEQKVPTGVIKQVLKSGKKSNFIIRLNSKDLSFPIVVRTRKAGDKMAIKNLDGTKKIKDILIDEKVPLEKRDILPIVLDSKNQVLWIPGVKKSKFDVETDGIYDIILSYEEEK